MELKKGYQNTELGEIPIDWDVKNLMECCIKIQDGNYGESYPKPHEFLEFGIPFLTSKAIGKEGILNESKIDFISDEKHSELIKAHLNYGDVLFTNRGASVGAIGYVEEKISNGNIGPQLTLLRSKKDVIQPKYLFQALKSGIVQQQIKSNDSGSAMNFFGIGETSKFKILLPQKQQEQIAIANALSDADAYITSLEKLIEKKRQIKQGAMQELLKPSEGWETKRLGEVIRVQGGYAFKSSLFSDNGIPVIRISDVFDGTVSLENCMHSKEINIPIDFKVCNGDVLIAMSGATTGKIGVYQNMDLAYINQRVGKFVILNSKKNSIEFVSHFLNSDKFKSGLIKEIAQGAQPNISGKQIESIEIEIPSDLKIQKEIASTLTIMDEEIRKLELKLQKGKSIKQGMMQNLLTGKIRLI